jgi:hypothetical protein
MQGIFLILNECIIYEIRKIKKNLNRVVNVASRLGLLGQLTSEELKNKYRDENSTIEDINNLVNQYIEYV